MSLALTLAQCHCVACTMRALSDVNVTVCTCTQLNAYTLALIYTLPLSVSAVVLPLVSHKGMGHHCFHLNKSSTVHAQNECHF